MRVALLILLMLVPTLLSATSYPFGVFKGTVRTVADGRFVYVELDPDYRPGSKGHGHWLRIEGGVEKGAGWAASGLYPADDPEHPVWIGSLDCLFGGQVFASRDGHVAVVLRDGPYPVLQFYRGGAWLHEWRVPPAWQPGGTASTSFRYSAQIVAEQLWLTDHRQHDLYFSLSTGDYLGENRWRRPVKTSLGFATTEELADFEKALGGDEPAPNEGSIPDDESGDWVGDVPAGASVFVSADGAVRVVQIPTGGASGPETAAYDAQGRRLWSVGEVLPRPVFLGDQSSGTVLGKISTPERGEFPLAISADGRSWVLLQYDPEARAASARLFNGKETHLAFPSTYEGELKFSRVSLIALSGERLAVVLGYGTDWSEEYRVRLADGAIEHLTNFPEETAQDESAVRRSSGSSYFWLSIIVPAAFVLLVGFLLGRITKRT